MLMIGMPYNNKQVILGQNTLLAIQPKAIKGFWGTGNRMEEVSDSILVRRACAGNYTAFHSLVERYYNSVLKLAYLWAGDIESAEAISRESFLQLFESIGKQERMGNFKVGLFRLTLKNAREKSVLPPPETCRNSASLSDRLRQLKQKERESLLLISAIKPPRTPPSGKSNGGGHIATIIEKAYSHLKNIDSETFIREIDSLELPQSPRPVKQRIIDEGWSRISGKPPPGENKKKLANFTLYLFFSLSLLGLAYGMLQQTFSQLDKILIGITAGIRQEKTPGLLLSQENANYLASIRTSLIRMLIAGIPAEKARFNHGQTLDLLSTPAHGLFHPDGGKIVYSPAPPEIMESSKPGTWFFNMNLAIEGLKSPAGELTAYLPGVREIECRKVNTKKGISGIPELAENQSELYKASMIDGKDTVYEPPSQGTLIARPELAGSEEGCFRNKDGEHVYFYVLRER